VLGSTTLCAGSGTTARRFLAQPTSQATPARWVRGADSSRACSRGCVCWHPRWAPPGALPPAGGVGTHPPTPRSPRAAGLAAPAQLFQLQAYTPPSWAAKLPHLPQQRYRLAQLPTPIHPWAVPGLPPGCELWIKRDDLTGMQLSGNKVRCRLPSGNVKLVLASCISNLLGQP
jgi:hypothetical protein